MSLAHWKIFYSILFFYPLKDKRLCYPLKALTQHFQIEKEVVELFTNKGPIGKTFKGDAKAIISKLSSLDVDEMSHIETSLKETGWIFYYVCLP